MAIRATQATTTMAIRIGVSSPPSSSSPLVGLLVGLAGPWVVCFSVAGAFEASGGFPEVGCGLEEPGGTLEVNITGGVLDVATGGGVEPSVGAGGVGGELVGSSPDDSTSPWASTVLTNEQATNRHRIALRDMVRSTVLQRSLPAAGNTKFSQATRAWPLLIFH